MYQILFLAKLTELMLYHEYTSRGHGGVFVIFNTVNYPVKPEHVLLTCYNTLTVTLYILESLVLLQLLLY